MKKLLCATTAMLALFATSVPAQQNQADATRSAYYEALKGKKVIFVSYLAANEYSQAWYAGMKSELEPLGVTIEMRDANMSASTGAQAFTQALGQSPDIIIAHNPDLTAYARLIQQAQSQGIHVVSINLISNAEASGYVGPDWVKIGEEQAKAVVDYCKDKSGQVAIVQGSSTAAPNHFAMQGIEAVFSENPNIKIVSTQSADWDVNKAKAISSTVLKQNPELCGIIGTYDGMDQGIAAAVAEAGLTGKVHVSTAGAGGDAIACNLVRSGAWDSYIAYDIRKQVTALNTMITALLSSGVKAGEFHSLSYTPLTVITKANVDRPGLCWDKID